MADTDDGGATPLRALAVAAAALAGLAFSLTPIADRADDAVLDVQWRLLRAFAPRAGTDDLIVVGVDEATLRAYPEPPSLWHEPLGVALVRIAAAKPRAIALDFPLPERSYDAIRPGMDRALFTGLVAAGANGPFVAALNIDPATRAARRIHTPFLAALGEARLGIGLAAVDADGVTRRFSLRVPTEDGGFPTLAGRLCKALSRHCSDGLIDYALGPPVLYVPLQNVVDAPDDTILRHLFAGRIVLVGQARKQADRLQVPLNLAGWEGGGTSSPSIVVHGQMLRTALSGAPQEASSPAVAFWIAIAATVVLVRRARAVVLVALAGAVALFLGSTWALRNGFHLPVTTAVAVLALAALAVSLREGRRRGR